MKRLLRPHALIVTALIALVIACVKLIPINTHFLDPYNNALQDYEITDIVYTRLNPEPDVFEDRIVLINSGKPDRQDIIQLIEKLDSAQAKVIGIDLLFKKFTENPIDSLLRDRLQQTDQVVLGCELHHNDEHQDRFDRIDSVDPFFTDSVSMAYVNFPVGSNRTVRFFSPKEQVGDSELLAFSSKIVEKYDPGKAKILLDRCNAIEEIHFLGNRDYFLRFDINQILDGMSLEELTAKVKGKIILIGYASEEFWMNPLVDRHYTPLNKVYSGKTIPDMYGVVLHANVIRMILSEEYIYPLPGWIEKLLNFLFCYFNVLLIYWIYYKFHEAFHGVTRVVQIVECLILFLVVAYLFYFFRVKVQLGWGILALLLAYEVIMVYETWLRERLPVLNKIPNYVSFSRKTEPIQGVETSNQKIVEETISDSVG